MRFLIQRHLELYADNPEYANVVMLILKGNRNFLKTAAYKIVQQSARFYIEVLKEGIQNGEFREDIQPYLVRAMIWGTIDHTVTRKSLLGEPSDLMALVDAISESIFQGIRSRPDRDTLRLKVQVDKDTAENL